MTTFSDYETAAHAYVEGVRAMFTPAALPRGERSGGGPTLAEGLSEQAEQLAEFSAQLTEAARVHLEDVDPAVRALTSTQLLAKALTDLEISAYMYQAAMDDEEGLGTEGVVGAERSALDLEDLEQRLALLLGEAELHLRLAERGEVAPSDVPTARVELSNAVADALALISERATRTGQTALTGLMGLGVSELAQAAGVVGLDIAEALGYGEKFSRLYTSFRDFAVQSYDSLLALLGRQLAQTAAQKVLDWLDKVKQGALFGQLLEKLFETQPTVEAVRQVVAESQAELDTFVDSIEGVDGLTERYRQQTELAGKILRAVAFVGTLPLAVLPQPKVLLGAAYILVAAYVILCGADYVDAPQLRLLNRVRGVRQLVEANLSSP